MPSMWSYFTSTTRSGRSGVKDRSLPAFHREVAPLVGVRLPISWAAHAHGWWSKSVTSGCSSSNSSLRRAMGNAPITPTLCSDPSSVCSPSSSEPIASSPLLWVR